MKVGENVRTAIALPGIPSGTTGTVKEVNRPFVLVSFEDGREGYYARQQLISVANCCCRAQTGAEAAIPFGISELEVPRGAHACLLPSSESVALEATARFAAAGLRNGEAVICAVPQRLGPAFTSRLRQVAGAVACEDCLQRLITMRPSGLYLPPSHFTGTRQLEKTVTTVTTACGANCNGARVFAYVGGRPSLPGWWEYEELVTLPLSQRGITALCVYDHTGWGTEAWHRAIALHHYVVRDDHVSTGDLALTG